jgi:hypothetical protein
VLDVDKCIERIKRQQAEAKALIDSNEELFAIVGEANEKLEATINSHKEKEE